LQAQLQEDLCLTQQVAAGAPDPAQQPAADPMLKAAIHSQRKTWQFT